MKLVIKISIVILTFLLLAVGTPLLLGDNLDKYRISDIRRLAAEQALQRAGYEEEGISKTAKGLIQYRVSSVEPIPADSQEAIGSTLNCYNPNAGNDDHYVVTIDRLTFFGIKNGYLVVYPCRTIYN